MMFHEVTNLDGEVLANEIMGDKHLKNNVAVRII